MFLDIRKRREKNIIYNFLLFYVFLNWINSNKHTKKEEKKNWRYNNLVILFFIFNLYLLNILIINMSYTYSNSMVNNQMILEVKSKVC